MLPKISNLFRTKKQTEQNQDFIVVSIDQEALSLGIFEVDGNEAIPTKSTKEERSSDLLSVMEKALASFPQDDLPKRLIIGISDDQVETTTTIARLNRENKEAIKGKEIEGVLTQVGEQYGVGGKKLFFSSITATVLDGVRVGNPVGARGEVLELGCFNAYLEEEKLSFFDKVSEELELDLEKVVPVEYAVVRGFLNSGTKDGILVKVLKDYTSLSFVEDSNIVGVKIFALGSLSPSFWLDGIIYALEEFVSHPRWPNLVSFYDTQEASKLEEFLRENLPKSFPKIQDLKVENLNTRLQESGIELSLSSLSYEGLDL